MKVISTNIARPRTVEWRGREIQTGIYKEPVDGPIYLGKEDVVNDTVIDRKHHGGEYKACYLFGSDYYDDWKKKYPQLDWNWGMFGENLTVDGLDEHQLQIGAVYTLGEATVQITEPRQPCYKLGIKFGTQKVIIEFLEYAHALDGMVKSERAELIRNCIKRLSPKDATLLTLFYLEEKNLNELGEILKMGESSVKVGLFRARGRLAKILKQYLEPEIIRNYG